MSDDRDTGILIWCLAAILVIAIAIGVECVNLSRHRNQPPTAAQ